MTFSLARARGQKSRERFLTLTTGRDEVDRNTNRQLDNRSAPRGVRSVGRIAPGRVVADILTRAISSARPTGTLSSEAAASNKTGRLIQRTLGEAGRVMPRAALRRALPAGIVDDIDIEVNSRHRYFRYSATAGSGCAFSSCLPTGTEDCAVPVVLSG